MPWWLKGCHGSAISVMSLKAEGAEDMAISDMMKDPNHPYQRDDGGWDAQRYRRDLWKKQALRFVRRRKAPTDTIPSPNNCIFSNTVKGGIDDLEPGVHTPLPVKILQSDGSKFGEDFWVYPVGEIPRLPALDLTATDVEIAQDPPVERLMIQSVSLPTYESDPRIKFDADVIRNRHFFVESRSGANWIFFSDVLWERLGELGAQAGFSCERVG